MISFFTKFFTRPPGSPAAKPGGAPAPKSAARLADEQNILAARRTILANMARIEKNPSAKEKVVALIDKDTDRASAVVRKILLGEGPK
jgi:hypothetical protein